MTTENVPGGWHHGEWDAGSRTIYIWDGDKCIATVSADDVDCRTAHENAYKMAVADRMYAVLQRLQPILFTIGKSFSHAVKLHDEVVACLALAKVGSEVNQLVEEVATDDIPYYCQSCQFRGDREEFTSTEVSHLICPNCGNSLEVFPVTEDDDQVPDL